MNVLITGGAGFIGSHLSDYFLKVGHNVTIIDNLSSGKVENVSKKCNFVRGDINDVSLLERSFKGVDLCYHLAAIPSVQKSVEQWVECNKVNLVGTINVFLQAARKGIPVVYASSAAVYGDAQTLPLSEELKVRLISPYGADKYSCEIQAGVFGYVHGLRSLGLRFFNVYGPRQDPNSPYSGVISIFSDRIIKGKPLDIYGDGSQVRDFIFIDDVVRCLDLAKDFAAAEAEVYNVSTGYGVTINELIDNLFKIVKKPVPINYLDWREGDIYKSVGSPNKAKQSMSFEAQNDLYNGLQVLLASKEII